MVKAFEIKIPTTSASSSLCFVLTKLLCLYPIAMLHHHNHQGRPLQDEKGESLQFNGGRYIGGIVQTQIMHTSELNARKHTLVIHGKNSRTIRRPLLGVHPTNVVSRFRVQILNYENVSVENFFQINSE